MNNYHVTLIWRYRPEGKRPYHATAGYLVVAENEESALARAAFSLTEECDKVRGVVRLLSFPVTPLTSSRRCRFDRNDGYRSENLRTLPAKSA